MVRTARRLLPCLLVLSAAATARGDDLVLGMSAAFSGPSGSLGTELRRGAEAYFDALNERGGVYGRRVVIRALDDAYEPQPAIDNTLRLLGDDAVLALFGYVGTPTVTRVLPLLKQRSGADALLFFAFTGAQPLRRPPYGELTFNLRASYEDETHGLVDRLLEIGLDRIGLFYQADAYGRSGWSGVRGALRERGLGIAAEATYRRGAGFDDSFEAQVALLREVDAVISVGSYEACGGFVRDARDAGLDFPIANLSFVGSEELLALLSSISTADGIDYTRRLVNSQVVPSYEDTSLPAVREYREALLPQARASAPGTAPEPHFSFVSFEGFLDAKLMTAILERLGPDARRDALRRAAESLDRVDLGIGTPLGFGPDNHEGLSRVWYTTVRDGRFVTLEDWEALRAP